MRRVRVFLLKLCGRKVTTVKQDKKNGDKLSHLKQDPCFGINHAFIFNSKCFDLKTAVFPMVPLLSWNKKLNLFLEMFTYAYLVSHPLLCP